MKRIVILCDGTWRASDNLTPTNVMHVARSLPPTDPSGVSQVPVYLPGVGNGQGVTNLSRKLDVLLGGAFGWGLLDRVVEAYRHLVFLYEPGDEIYVFGFSRGAYTARSLTGLIRSTGMLSRDRLHDMKAVVARYQDRDATTHPGSGESHEFRAKVSPDVATSVSEVTWRGKRGLPEPHLLRISYLGIWDSVGALGIPATLAFAPWLNRGQYEFHDTNLSRLVSSARHAVALDETRAAFTPTCWTNISELNRNAEAGQGAPAYREMYFAGDHGSVGGGGDIPDLSNIALQWVLEGAERQGLSLDRERLAAYADAQNPFGPLCNKMDPPSGLVSALTRWKACARTGPEEYDGIHPSVAIRWRAGADVVDPPYRPSNLKRFHDALADGTATSALRRA